MNIEDIKTPKTREDMIELAKLAIYHMEKINKIWAEAFSNCGKQKSKINIF